MSPPGRENVGLLPSSGDRANTRRAGSAVELPVPEPADEGSPRGTRAMRHHADHGPAGGTDIAGQIRVCADPRGDGSADRSVGDGEFEMFLARAAAVDPSHRGADIMARVRTSHRRRSGRRSHWWRLRNDWSGWRRRFARASARGEPPEQKRCSDNELHDHVSPRKVGHICLGGASNGGTTTHAIASANSWPTLLGKRALVFRRGRAYGKRSAGRSRPRV